LRFGTSIILGFIAALLIVASPACAKNHVPIVYATAWGKTLAQDGTGFYNEIAGDILAHTPGPELYQIMPYRRAKVSFFMSKGRCLFPSSLPALVKAGQIATPENYIESNTLFAARTHLFVRAGETPPKSFGDLFGKSIAYSNGSVVRSTLEGSGARLISVNDEQDKAEMLVSGRVDIISGMIPDTAIVFGEMGGDMPLYEPTFALNELGVTFVCHKTVKTELFVEGLNLALDVLSVDADYLERMATANLAKDMLARASGDEGLATEHALNDLAPSAGPGRALPKPRSGRRLPMRANR